MDRLFRVSMKATSAKVIHALTAWR